MKVLVATLIVAALAGCVQSENSTLAPTPEPTASGFIEFTYEPTAPASGEKITFQALGAIRNGTSVESFTWNFGDGEQIVGSLVRHTYDFGGAFEVELVANLTDGSQLESSEVISVTGPSNPGQPNNDPTKPGGNNSNQAAPVETIPREWPDPTTAMVRPGDSHAPDGCTLNFMFQYGERFFFGSAGHCMSGGPDDDGELWSCGDGDYSAPLGSTTTVGEHSMTLTLAYSAWDTMHRVKETDSDICRGNDFILLEISPDDLTKVHPAVHRYGGPTGLGSIESYSLGDDIRGYGRSSLHDDTLVYDEDQSLTNPKTGIFIGPSYGGWSYNVYLLPQGIPGDSGGGIMDGNGLALGAASTISLAGGSNNYANIERALQYMQQKEGWAPTLVTWDEWDPDPRVPI